MVIFMSADKNSADHILWFMREEPIFERSFGVIEGGTSVEKTERLTLAEVDEIIRSLSSNDYFMSMVSLYIERTKDEIHDFSKEEDSHLYSKILRCVDELLSEKNLKMNYFFSNSIVIELFQRIEKEKLENR